jgi:hypothetical protein
MRNVPQHITDRLKQQPRQGADPTTDLLGAYKDGLDASMSSANVFIGGLSKISAGIKQQGEEFIKLINAQNSYQEANAGLQKSFGMNAGEAAEMGATLDTLAKKMGVGGGKLRAYQANLKGLVGGFAGVTSKIGSTLQPLLRAQTIIQTNLQLSGEQANKFTQYAAGVGKDADTQLIQYQAIADTLTKNFKIQVSTRDLVADITSMTADVQMQYGKIPEKLAIANLKAKALGLSMADLNKTGQGLLNIESSIGEELEYQLLSGRRLINEETGESLTNAYRTATIQGDANKQAELMNQILDQEGETLEKNMFARQQMAKLLGTDEATVARTLQQQKLLTSIGATEFLNSSMEDFQGKLANNPAFMAMDDKKKEEFLKTLQKTADTRTPDQRAADALESIVSNGIAIASSPKDMQKKVEEQQLKLEAAFDDEAFIAKLQEELLTKGNIDVTGKALTTIDTGLKAADMVLAFKDAVTSTTFTNPWKISATNVTLSTPAVDGNDIAMGPGSSRTLFGPEGAINLNDKDSIIAGTNLFGGSPGGGADVAALAGAIVAAINKQTDELTSNSRMNGQYWT